MGRFSSICVVLLGACGDNAVDQSIDGADDQTNPNGNATDTPRYVPSVCGVQTWSTSAGADLAMNVSVAPRTDGAIVLAAPSDGGSLIGYILDTRMNMRTAQKIAIDGSFTQVSATYRGDRLVSAAVQEDSVFMHLLDDDLGNPQYVARLPGRHLAEPAFYNTQADLVMPVAGDDGLWLHRFQDSYEPIDSKLVIPSKPAMAMTSAQMGVALLTAWSTAEECYIMLTSTFSAGINKRVDTQCMSPRLAVNGNSGEGVMVFETTDGVRLMNIQQTQFGGDARLLRDSTSSPRTLFDGTNFWISYLDTRGDIIVGFLDGDRKLVTMSLAGPKPETQAYELVMVDNNPWVFALGNDGYTAHRMCIDTQW